MKFSGVVGLSDAEVEQSRRTYGWNGLPKASVESFWDKLYENFKDPLIKILLVALAITMTLALLGYAKWFEGVGIAVAVFLATFVSTLSEHKNEESFQELQEKASKVTNNVFRNGSFVHSVLVNDIVRGDRVLLQAGDKVPADGHLMMGSVSVDQSSLTGEADAVPKEVAPEGFQVPENPSNTDISDSYCVFRGTLVDDGEGVLVVDRVGKDTYFGQMQEDLFHDDDRESPLQLKLGALADGISRLGYMGAAGVALSFLFKQFIMDNNYSLSATMAYLSNWPVALHDAVNSVILGIIIIVVAVPEGLPMMIAIVLSLNMRKLLAQNVLVRKLLGIETAGSLNVLFVDKTGTLTTGVFECKMFLSGEAGRDSLSGASVGVGENFQALPPSIQDLYRVCVMSTTTSVRADDGSLRGGNSSERALLQFIPPSSLAAPLEFRVEREVLFNSERKFGATQIRFPAFFSGPFRGMDSRRSSREDMLVSIVKGAPELILANCERYYDHQGALQQLDRDRVMSVLDYYSNQGVRFIALAANYDPLPPPGNENVMPSGMNLVGILGLSDTVRSESAASVARARNSGIQVVMITGDRRETAEGVAESVGLVETVASNHAGILPSEQLQVMSDEAIAAALPGLRVICRARPTDKSRLVRIAQSRNLVVGMTGDGVNDSAALRRADVGFAMGSGSEVAKEASDIVILDDNFESITKAVLYGRTIYLTIQKFIIFQSTVNLASGIVVFVGPFMGFDFPLTLIQLLWVNLVMDTLAALAFGGEPALSKYMHIPPIQRNQSIITPYMWNSILYTGVYIAVNCIIFLQWDFFEKTVFQRGYHGDGSDNDVFLTAFFAFFIFQSTINAFNVRTPERNILKHITENTGFLTVILVIFLVQMSFSVFGGKLLRTVGLTMGEWMFVIGLSGTVVPFDLLRKSLYQKYASAQSRRLSMLGDDYETSTLLQQVKTQ